MMKKIMVLIITICVCLMGAYIEHNYTKYDCMVIEATATGALIQTLNGEVWYYEGEGFRVGEWVNLRMHSNYTNDCFEDDIIKEVVKQ